MADYSFPGTLPPDMYATRYPNGNVRLHFGSCVDQSRVRNLDAHTATIDGVPHVIPFQGWNQDWIHWAVPPTIKRIPAQIVAANRMFPFGQTSLGVRYGSIPNFTYTGPMDNAGIVKYWGQTGERGDIGLVTDASGQYLLGGNPGPMLAWAYAAASVPIHFRDETTGKPFDMIKHPQANTYDVPGKAGDPWLDKGPPNPSSNGYHVYADNWGPQSAHEPELSYVAFQATRAVEFLHDLQFQATFGLTDASLSTKTTAIVNGEMRGIAWAFRELFMAHVATLDYETDCAAAGIPFPDFLHPSSYWKTIIDNQIAYYGKMITNPDPTIQLFRVFANFYRFGYFQYDYFLTSLAFGVLTGHSELARLYLWCLGNVIARTNGTSGWPVAWAGYYLNATEGVTNSDGSLDLGHNDLTKPLTWAGSFAYLQKDNSTPAPTAAQVAALKADPMNSGIAIGTTEYLLETRAVLVEAAYLEKIGLVNVRAQYPDLDRCLANVETLVRNMGTMAQRDSIVLDASQTSDQIPPTNPQPPTEITMTDTTIRVGETKHITLAVTPPDADQSGLAYTAAPEGLVTLAPDASGVSVTRHAQGVVTVTASLNGLTATAEAQDAAPLALSIALSWDS